MLGFHNYQIIHLCIHPLPEMIEAWKIVDVYCSHNIIESDKVTTVIFTHHIFKQYYPIIQNFGKRNFAKFDRQQLSKVFLSNFNK